MEVNDLDYGVFVGTIGSRAVSAFCADESKPPGSLSVNGLLVLDRIHDNGARQATCDYILQGLAYYPQGETHGVEPSEGSRAWSKAQV